MKAKKFTQRCLSSLAAILFFLGLFPPSFSVAGADPTISPAAAYPDFAARTVLRVSVATDGTQANNNSYSPSISADGRFVAFYSTASNIVPMDTNGGADVFVHDRLTGVTQIVSVASDGTHGNSTSQDPSISADGRFVAFWSYAGNLVPGDTNSQADVFVHDRQTGETRRVSVTSAQGQSCGDHPSISADGRYVAFQSICTNLVPHDANYWSDIFVHDRQTGNTEIVSVDSSGNQGSGESSSPAISADGRFVAFESTSPELVPGDTNKVKDVFVHDRQTGATERVSVSSSGGQSNDTCGAASCSLSISTDGRYVAFQSIATNLVPGDSNNRSDIFVHDRQNGETARVSVSSNGVQGNDVSVSPSISANGRYVAFDSIASNLVSGDSVYNYDIFIHDRQTHATTLVSTNNAGAEGNGYSRHAKISANMQWIAFASDASNLVAGDTNQYSDIFEAGTGIQLEKTIIYSRYQANPIKREARLLNAGNGSDQWITNGSFPRLSPDGNYIAFLKDGGYPPAYQNNLYVRDLADNLEWLAFTNTDFIVGYDWTNDSQQIVFDFECGIYRISRDGSGQVPLITTGTQSCYNDAPAVKPTDNSLAFHNRYIGLLTADSSGGGVSHIPNTLPGDQWPIWSKDGQWISFIRGKNFDTRIGGNFYKIHPDGTGLTQLTFLSSNQDNQVYPAGAWSGNGFYLIGVARVSGQTRIYAIPTNASGGLIPLSAQYGAQADFLGSMIGNLSGALWPKHFYLPAVIR
jgi:Tol biopolymer transport system component